MQEEYSMKKFFGTVCTAFAASLLLASCASTPEASLFTDFTAKTARHVNASYDIHVISTEDTICKVYKLTEQPGKKTFYALSDVGKKSDGAKVAELTDFVVITKENADALCSFIDQVADAYAEKTRGSNDAVLYDFAIVRDYTYQEMTVDSITSRGSEKDSVVTKSMKEFQEEDEQVRVQLKTAESGDVIILAVAGYAQTVTPRELLTLKAALTETKPQPQPQIAPEPADDPEEQPSQELPAEE